MFQNIIISSGGTMVGFILCLFLLKRKKIIDIEKNKKDAEEIIEKNKKEGEKTIEEANNIIRKRKESIKQETLKKEERLKFFKESLDNKEEFLKKRIERINEIKAKIITFNAETINIQNTTKKIKTETSERLTKKVGQNKEELRTEILTKYKKELEQENQEKLAKQEEELRENIDKTAKSQIISVIQRLCSPTSVESRAITIKILKDHIKGKIVGKDGKNIETLETLLNVDIVFNDEPNIISISAFQLVNRRIAQKALEKLVRQNGEINTETIKKTVKEAEKEIDAELYEMGKKALEKIGIDNTNKEFIKIVGRLQFRTSYGQNIMKHSMEVSWIATILASELGLDKKTCKIAGFLHDLGKAIDQDPNIDKPHDELTKILMEKYGFSEGEIHAAWTHHDSMPQKTPEALIVKAADAISAGRPGARQESFDKYLERIKALQDTAESFEGIKKAYTLSAGREIRAIVDPDTINDEGIKIVAEALANKIEENLTYPGQIKVKVIRRTKHTEIAG